MDTEKIKEELSICYLQAIAAIKGIALEIIRHDEDSTDVQIKKVIALQNGRRFNSHINIQLKSTSSPSMYSIGVKDVSYKLKSKNYNDLCTPSAIPCILALFILPPNENDWINWTTEDLLIRGKMFWLEFPKEKYSNNESSVTVKIPKTNQISVDSIDLLLEKAAKESGL